MLRAFFLGYANQSDNVTRSERIPSHHWWYGSKSALAQTFPSNCEWREIAGASKPFVRRFYVIFIHLPHQWYRVFNVCQLWPAWNLSDLPFANLYSKVWVAESSNEPGPDGYLFGKTSFDTPCPIPISTLEMPSWLKWLKVIERMKSRGVVDLIYDFFRCLAMCWWMFDSSEPFENSMVSIVMICQGES